MQPKRRPVRHLDGEHETHDNMADDNDGEIRGSVVGPVMVQLLSTMGTSVDHLQIAPEHSALAASRAFERRPPPQRVQDRASARRSAAMLKAANSILHHLVLVISYYRLLPEEPRACR